MSACCSRSRPEQYGIPVSEHAASLTVQVFLARIREVPAETWHHVDDELRMPPILELCDVRVEDAARNIAVGKRAMGYVLRDREGAKIYRSSGTFTHPQDSAATRVRMAATLP